MQGMGKVWYVVYCLCAANIVLFCSCCLNIIYMGRVGVSVVSQMVVIMVTLQVTCNIYFFVTSELYVIRLIDYT